MHRGTRYLPVENTRRVYFMQDRRKLEDYHLFVGMEHGVSVRLPPGIVGKGTLTTLDGKIVNECVLHFTEKSLLTNEAFVNEYNRVWEMCYHETVTPANDHVYLTTTETHLKARGSIPESFLRTSPLIEYTCIVESIRIIGFQLVGNKVIPTIAVENSKSLTIHKM